jgi:uncharacterized damage-inducible protein DinB
MSDAKQQFLETYEREHQTTMKVLRAFPEGRVEEKLHPNVKTAKELAWVFVLERGLGAAIFNDAMAKGQMSGQAPSPPEKWSDLLAALEKGHKDFGDVVRNTSDEDLQNTVTFLVGPKTPGPFRRIDFAWFMLQDQIHHRGQFSILMRMAGVPVPSIYGPSESEPWM